MVDNNAGGPQMTLLAVVAFGCVGGLLPEVLKHVRKLESKKLPDGFEIAISVILATVGGVVAGIDWQHVPSPEIAVGVGAAAPAMIGAWQSGGKGPQVASGAGGASRGLGDGPAATQRMDLGSRIGRALSWRA